jgi:dihydropteroate synthase
VLFQIIPPHSPGLTSRDRPFIWGDRTYLMGILNVTPDSFSDGGQFDRLDAAIAQAQSMAQAGADILDIGGQSTRPGAVQIDLAEELDRVIPVIESLRQAGFDLPISVDTTRSAVAQAAIEAGADWVNDISGASFDPEMLPMVARLGVPIVLMHLRGTPQTMQSLTDYADLAGEIAIALMERVDAAIAAGVQTDQIILDPGIGFAKTADQNYELLRNLPRLAELGYPLLVGPSRKSFIGKTLDQPDPNQRLWGTAAACSGAIALGAHILRVHDVHEMRDVIRVSDSLWKKQYSYPCANTEAMPN